MLQLRETRIIRSLPERVAPGVVIPEEGIPLSYVKVDGETCVQPCTGAADEIFAGVSLSRNSPPAALPMVVEFAYGSGSGKFPRAPIGGQLMVKNVADGVTRTVVAAAPAAGEIQVDAQGNYALNVADAGANFTAQFHYIPSVVEAQSIIGDAPIGGLPSTALGEIGALKQATISTNFFDASVDWSTAMYVALANGMFTVGSAADHVPNVVVRNAPSADNAFLTLSINVA